MHGFGFVGDVARRQMCSDRGCGYDSFSDQCLCPSGTDTIRRAPRPVPSPSSPSAPVVVASSGISTTTVLLVGAAVVGGAYLLGKR